MTTHPAPPPAAQTREPGWYWVRHGKTGPWEVAEYGKPSDFKSRIANKTFWYAVGYEGPLAEPPPGTIGPRIPTPASAAIGGG